MPENIFKPEVYSAVEETYRSRRSTQGIKPGSAADKKAQVEFFCGAMAALSAIDKAGGMPPRWCIPLMTGRLVVEKDAEPRKFTATVVVGEEEPERFDGQS